MESVRSYFNGTGFERWNKIYGETDDVNKVPPCAHSAGTLLLQPVTGSASLPLCR
jgi:hypothetical protein